MHIAKLFNRLINNFRRQVNVPKRQRTDEPDKFANSPTIDLLSPQRPGQHIDYF